MGTLQDAVEAHTWAGEGYQPLVFSAGWMVALLNWEPLFDPAHLREIERHVQTDEVFILLRGRAVLFVATDQGLELLEMLPGALYNVRQGTWHNLVATRDAAWAIVEGRDTHLHDTEVRPLSTAELAQLRTLLAEWMS